MLSFRPSCSRTATPRDSLHDVGFRQNLTFGASLRAAGMSHPTSLRHTLTMVITVGSDPRPGVMKGG